MLEGELDLPGRGAAGHEAQGRPASSPRATCRTRWPTAATQPARYVLVCTPAGSSAHFARMAAEQAGEAPPEWALQPIPEVTLVGPQIDG